MEIDPESKRLVDPLLRARQASLPKDVPRADLNHWVKAATWTLEEAIALSLGREPRALNSLVVKTVSNRELAEDFVKRLDLARRAVSARQLFDPVLPTFFLSWAKRLKIRLDPELLVEVDELGLIVADWKELVEAANKNTEVVAESWKAAYQEMSDKWVTLVSEKVNLIDSLTEQLKSANESLEPLQRTNEELLQALMAESAKCAGLAERIRAIEQDPSPNLQASIMQVPDNFGTRARESLLKLIIGMAIAGYRFDPNATKNDAIKEIESDLAKLGLDLSDDTIRKWLRQAAELLPPKPNSV